MKVSPAVKFITWCSLVVTGVTGAKLLRQKTNSKTDDGQEDPRLLVRSLAAHHVKADASVVNKATTKPNLVYFGGPSH